METAPNVMDMWEFKKWRRMLGLTQVDAADKLGVSRGSVQNWEGERNPIPFTVDLACREFTRHWKQRPEFGPVTLVYADAAMWQTADEPHRTIILQCMHCENNETAIRHACRMKQTLPASSLLIMAEDGTVIWSGPELQRECKRKSEEAAA
jgi:DNA-binding XRE family transcriptional regulator